MLGIVGGGRWGKNLIRNFRELGVLEAVCDAQRAARLSVRQAYPEVSVVSDLKSLLAIEAIRFIVVATPAETHGVIVREALKAGKDVFVEKPLCLDVDEALDLKKLAASLGRKVMVGHLLNYHPAFEKILAMVKIITQPTTKTNKYINNRENNNYGY